MPTMKLKAVKMTDAKANFVSLVERGANRIPFRIVKKEKDMNRKSPFAGLDLMNVFKSEESKVPAKAELLGVATLKDENFEAVTQQLKDAGVSVDNPVEMEDGTVVFKQTDADPVDGEIIRLNSHVALITKGFRPYNMDITQEGQTFEDKCTAQGFYPGVRTMVDVLSSSVNAIVEKAGDPATAAEEVGNMFDEAKLYAMSLVESLPTVAFKADISYAIAAEKVEAPAGDEEEKTEEQIAAEAVAAAEAADTVAKAAAAKPAADADGDMQMDKDGKPCKAKKADEPAAAPDVTKIVADQVSAAMGDFSTKLTTMFKGLSDTVQKSLGNIETKVKEVETVAKEAKAAVAGTVVSGNDDDGDGVAGTKVKKEFTEYGSAEGTEIDTAFMGKRNRFKAAH